MSVRQTSMLPTPDTSHVNHDRVYEPAEDSFLLLDTLSSAEETAFLKARFTNAPSPTICEVGTGSGVVLAFLTAQCKPILGREDVLTLGTDLNAFACQATVETVERSVEHSTAGSTKAGVRGFLGVMNTDLTACLRPGSVDVLMFNPPYVPAPMPDLSKHEGYNTTSGSLSTIQAFDRDSHMLELSYAGGVDGMEITNRLLDQLPSILTAERGVAYVLLCAQNNPEQIKARIADWEGGWSATIVGRSGKQAGWENLVILRICHETASG